MNLSHRPLLNIVQKNSVAYRSAKIASFRSFEERKTTLRDRLLLNIALSIAALVCSNVALAEDSKPQASGNVAGKKLKFEAKGAYAFPGKVGLNDEAGILVAVSNVPFNASMLDMHWDRRNMIDSYFRDDETLVAYFQFSKAGEYKGMSYHFASGDGCALCFDGTTKSSVKVDRGQVKGKLQLAQKDDDAYFDVTVDVPLATSDYGKPLPADGGEPGKAYAALHRVLEGSDPSALKPIVVERLASKLADLGADVLAVLQDEHPSKSYKIVKGFVKDDRALLIIEGANATINVKTEAHLIREQGQWRFDNEVMQMRFEE